MAGKKKYLKTKKNKNKLRKKVSSSVVVRRKVVTTQPLTNNTKPLSKRGRPKLPWWVRIKRATQQFFPRFFKKIQVRKNKLLRAQHQFLLNSGLKKGRGRKKTVFYRRWSQSYQLYQRRRQKAIAQQRRWWQQRYQQLAAVLRLRRRAGRPSKKAKGREEFKKKIFEPRRIFTIRFFRWPGWSFRLSIVGSLLLTFLIIFSTYQAHELILKDLPSPTQLSSKRQILSTKILDRHGKLLYRVYEDENRTLVPLQEVSLYLRQATVAIEDKDFYQHPGFSLEGIIRAFFTNLTEDSMQGGSTITQQLVKNRLLNNDKTLQRKLREVLLAILVERTYSKDQILEMYLNTVSYGGSTYGIEEAAQRYFAKSARSLDLAEAALLAGLPVAPSVYSPFGANPELAKQRQAEVLRRMMEDGYVTQAEADAAKAEKLIFNQDATAIAAPHFVMYLRKLLAEKYGEQEVAQGGLEVTTTLDLSLQNEAQALVTEEVKKLSRLQVTNGAALVTNPKTGEILAMVGSIDYFDFAHDGQVNVTLRPRQPGSSIKPLVYATAFEHGASPATIVDDSPVVYQIPGSKPYAPVNYDGKFHGRVSMRQALASSYNVPAVKTLASLGVSTVLDEAEKLGITTWQERSRFGLSLALGAGEVRMVDMAQLYSTFANLGYPVPLNPILEVKDYRGQLLYRNDCALYEGNCYEDLALSPTVAYLITDILSDNQARSAAFGLYSVLNIPNQQVAVKTGTTNSMKDNWTIGYSSDRLVATWVGNNDSSSMSYVASGITGASPIWNKIMLLLLDSNQPHRFAMPEQLIKVAICSQTGTLPCGACPKVSEEIFVQGTQPTRSCNEADFQAKEEQLVAR